MEITVRPVTADIRFAEAPGDMQSANFRTPANIIILVLAGFGAIALVFYVYHYFETKKMPRADQSIKIPVESTI